MPPNNRMRLTLRVAEQVRSRVPDELPVFVRLQESEIGEPYEPVEDVAVDGPARAVPADDLRQRGLATPLFVHLGPVIRCEC